MYFKNPSCDCNGPRKTNNLEKRAMLQNVKTIEVFCRNRLSSVRVINVPFETQKHNLNVLGHSHAPGQSRGRQLPAHLVQSAHLPKDDLQINTTTVLQTL